MKSHLQFSMSKIQVIEATSIAEYLFGPKVAAVYHTLCRSNIAVITFLLLHFIFTFTSTISWLLGYHFLQCTFLISHEILMILLVPSYTLHHIFLQLRNFTILYLVFNCLILSISCYVILESTWTNEFFNENGIDPTLGRLQFRILQVVHSFADFVRIFADALPPDANTLRK